MKYIVYITVNKINFKYYIGVHKVEDNEKWDYYLGCGAYANKPSSYNKTKTPLHAAILKYGPKNFIRYTLKTFSTLEEALHLESILVDEKCIKDPNTYNCTLGGGIPPIQNKTVYRYDLKGNFIKKYNSLIEATIDTKSYKDAITHAIKEGISFSSSFWTFEYLNKLNVSEYKIARGGEISQYNSEGILLKTFDSYSEAAQKLDIDKKAIIRAVSGKYKLHGFYFLKSWDNINKILEIKNKTISNNITKVYCYSLTGEFIKEYNSIKSVKNDIPNANHGNIIRAIKNNKTASGFRWAYEKVDNILDYENTIKTKPKNKVAQYDLQGNLVKVYDSVTECRKEFPNLLRVIRGERKHCKGYTFRYI